MTFDPTTVGGKLLQHGAGETWDFGWIPPDVRYAFMHEADAEALAEMPRFQIAGTSAPGDKVCIWDCWKHPTVLAANGGKVYPGTRQVTGSCVGVGGGNTVYALSAVEVARLNDPEMALIPFWPIPYGRSRFYAGMRGRGEGSMGSTFAKAVRVDGVVEARLPGLPPWDEQDALCWGREAELEWSAGDRISAEWLAKSRKHLVQQTAAISNADDLREAIRNYYPCSFAGDWGGMMECRTAGTPPVLLNERRGTWNHQQSVHGWWDHPELGELFYVLNQWGMRTHGTCPSGAPPGGYWIKKKDAEYQCRNGEVFAFSQFQGFPAQDIEISWLI